MGEVALCLVLVLAVVYVLFQYVFPWAEPLLPFNDVTVDSNDGRADERGDRRPMSARILVVDNYDSFVFNLVQYLYQLGAECEVLRNDEVDHAHARDGFDGVLLSPGPGTPEEAGVCVDMVRHCAETGVPVFGVCLGVQSMAVAYGAVVGRAPELLHGKTSMVDARRVPGSSPGCRSPFTATRYHSLAVDRDTVPAELRGHRLDGQRRSSWACATATPRRGRAVPPRVGAHRVGAPDARQLARRLRRSGAVGRSAGWHRWSGRRSTDREGRGVYHAPAGASRRRPGVHDTGQFEQVVGQWTTRSTTRCPAAPAADPDHPQVPAPPAGRGREDPVPRWFRAPGTNQEAHAVGPPP